jgi:hypothetical protein
MNDRLPGLPAYDVPPLDGQVLDLILFSTPDMWFNRMTELNDQLVEHIEGFGEQVQAKINGLSEGQAAVIGGAIGLVGGPLGGLVGAGAGYLLIGEVKDWLNGKLGDLVQQLWDAHVMLVDAMQACVDAIFGNPEKLMALGTGYQAAQSALGDASFQVSQDTDTLKIFWDGRGFEAYSGAAGQQTAAMGVMADKMGSASHLMADAAQMIQQCWSDIIQALVALVADVVDTLLGDIEITKLPTATVTAPVGVIVDGVNFLNAVVTAIREVSIQGRNTGFMAWAELTGGDSALDNSQWPKPAGLAANQYENDDNWGTTER